MTNPIADIKKVLSVLENGGQKNISYILIRKKQYDLLQQKTGCKSEKALVHKMMKQLNIDKFKFIITE